MKKFLSLLMVLGIAITLYGDDLHDLGSTRVYADHSLGDLYVSAFADGNTTDGIYQEYMAQYSLTEALSFIAMEMRFDNESIGRKIGLQINL